MDTLFRDQGLPAGSAVENPPAMQGCGFDPWVRKIPWSRKWQPTSVFCLKNPMDRGAWGTLVHGVAELDRTE